MQDAAALVRAANEQTSEGGSRWHSPGRFCAQSCPAAGPNDISCRELSKDDVTRRCHSWPPQEAAGRERRVGCALLPLTAPAAAPRGCRGGRRAGSHAQKLQRRRNFYVKSCRTLFLLGYRTQRLATSHAGNTAKDTASLLASEQDTIWIYLKLEWASATNIKRNRNRKGLVCAIAFIAFLASDLRLVIGEHRFKKPMKQNSESAILLRRSRPLSQLPLPFPTDF